MRTLTFVLATWITGATLGNGRPTVLPARDTPTNGGIYLSYDQFRQHNLSYPFDCRSSSDKLVLNNFLGGSSIRVIHQGERHSLQKDKIFGYRDCNGLDYRFYNKTPYHILDTAQFYLYSLDRLVQGTKIARPATVYYFSMGASDSPLPLTIANLETAFASNQAFIYKLHSEFRSDADLITYIPSLKTYKLKYAYGQSSK
jgi:hypothetical protein